MAPVRFIAAVFSRCQNFCFPSDEPANESWNLGRRGERIAAKFLRQNGYRVLYRNFRTKRGGEIDLVCRDRRESMLVFVEVKTRSSDDFGAPSMAVTREKQRLLERGARSWLRMLQNPDILFRFDVVEIVIQNGVSRVNLIKNAFEVQEPHRF